MSDDKPRMIWVYADLRGANLSGQSFRHADFRAAKLHKCDFTACDLSYADFRGAEMHNAIFHKAIMYGCKLQGAEAFGADFSNAKLQLANLAGAYLDGATFPLPEQKPMPSPSEILANPQAYQPEANGPGPVPRDHSVVEAAMHRDKDGQQGDSQGGYQPDRNRNLPEEQQKNPNKGPGRPRGRHR